MTTNNPEDLIPPCPPGGEGCHNWMYGAACTLAANGYDDNAISAFIAGNLKRPPQPQEIENTLRKVRSLEGGDTPPSPSCSFKRAYDQEKFAALTAEGPMEEDDFAATSPVDVSTVTTTGFLHALYPDRQVVLFNKYESQGQIVWQERVSDEAVRLTLGRNKDGAWFLVNPVTGKFATRADGTKTMRSEVNLTSYEYGLVESDVADTGLWLRLLTKLDLPGVAVTSSGNRSVHTIVRVGAADKAGWIEKMSEIADVVVPLGADPAAITAVRLSRLPGITRGDNGKQQRLLWFNPGTPGTGGAKETPEEAAGEPQTPDKPDDATEEKPSGKGALDDIYYDGKNFFMLGKDGAWRYETASMLVSELKCRGFTDRAPKGAAMSPLDRAKSYIRANRRVDGAGPSLYNKNDVWVHAGKRFLNTATNIRVTPAAAAAGPWGEGFPRLASILDNVFVDDDCKNVFLAWFKRFYESAEAGKLKLGQAMILVGPVHCYKTFLIERLLTPAMGGYADFSSVISGEGNGFNADLFQSPLAVIDDERAKESEAHLNKYASAVKKLAAHGAHKYHEKFMTPIMVEWRGRVVIAANDDPVSIKAVPALDMSNEDKLIALALKSFEDGPTMAQLEDVETELPPLLAWIKAWTPAARYMDYANRYVVRSYIAPSVRENIDSSGRAAELSDMLTAWWSRREDGVQTWEGTAVELHQAVHDSFDNSSLTREWPVRVLSRRLAELSTHANSGVELVNKRYGARKLHRYRLTRPEPEAPEPVSTDPF